jgi:hypothetical protein
MKRFVFACFFLAFMSFSLLYAAGYYTTIVGGFTDVSMSKVNSDIISTNTGAGINNTQLGGGMYFGIDGMLMSQEGLGLHLRAEYVGIATGEYEDNNTYGLPTSSPYYPTYNEVVYQDYQVTPYMTPLLLGISYTFHGNRADRFTLTAGIYGGVTDAFLDFHQRNTYDDGSGNQTWSNYDALFQGWGFCGEATVDLNYWFTQHFSFGLDLGYRYANIPQMTSVDDVYDNNGAFIFGGGSKLENASYNTVPVDFSGFNIGINLTYHFRGWMVEEEY